MKYQKYLLPLVFAQSFAGMLGSLYFSDVQNLAPCDLCWYQRIALYPIVLLSALGYLKNDEKIYHYVLPFSIGGLFISIYHNLIYFNLIPQALVPCSLSQPCTTHYITWLGFIDIPQMSLAAFALITLCMILHWRGHKKSKAMGILLPKI